MSESACPLAMCREAVDVHGLNFPDADHYCGDISKADIAGFPRADVFWSSPSCPPWPTPAG
jgi:DNA (cytosine-5)-methyltransferase 1